MTKNTHNTAIVLKQRSRESGFTLIEIAIALLVLAVGLLGIAGMQTTGMKNTLKSHQRAVAMTQAQDISDRIRANISGLRSMAYVQAISANAPSPTCLTSGATCTSTELAATDLFNWDAENAALLPSGQGSITCTDLVAGTTTVLEPGSDCTITLRWDSERAGVTGTGCSASSDLTCLRLRITL